MYRQTGGHAYGSAYSGPIGAVITPALEDYENHSGELAWMSSLCGACAEACPVKIPLDEQLVIIRAGARERDPKPAEAAFFEAWSRLWSRPSAYRATAATGGKVLAPLWAKAARAMAGHASAPTTASTPRRRPRAGADADAQWLPRVPVPFAGWTKARDVRQPAAEPFHARWRKRRG